jgi:hypothetical protein
MDRDKKHPLSSQAAEIVLIVGPMRGKSGFKEESGREQRVGQEQTKDE